MVAADKRAVIQRCDNGWVLCYWTRNRSEMSEHREVFTAMSALFGRLEQVFGIGDGAG